MLFIVPEDPLKRFRASYVARPICAGHTMTERHCIRTLAASALLASFPGIAAISQEFSALTEAALVNIAVPKFSLRTSGN